MTPGGERPPAIRYPAWMDAHYHLIASHSDYADVTFAMGETKQIVKGDARRWALGFIQRNAGGTNLLVSPFPNPDQYGWGLTLSVPVLWFTVFEFGPMVGAPWNGYSANAATYRVVEILLQ